LRGDDEGKRSKVRQRKVYQIRQIKRGEKNSISRGTVPVFSAAQRLELHLLFPVMRKEKAGGKEREGKRRQR
jgi:hypothetical protein